MNKDEFTKRAIRHGEVVLTPIDELPDGVEQIYDGKEYIVGHSESGHVHTAIGNLTIFQPVGADDSVLYLRANKDSVVKHRKSFDKHETKTIFKGLYMRTIKTAYDYFAKVQTRVID